MARNLCYCGVCPACQRSIMDRERMAARAGCLCGVENCDCAWWDEVFEKNHGEEMRDYYIDRALSMQSALREVL